MPMPNMKVCSCVYGSQQVVWRMDFLDKPFSAGSLLLDYIQNWELSSSDPYKVWFASVILSHVIRENDAAKHIAGDIVFGEEANGT